MIIILSPFDSFAGHKEKVFPNGLSAGRAGHCLKRRIAGLWGQFQGDDLLGQSDHAEILGFDERRCRHERNIGEKRSEKRGIKIGEERTLIQNLRYLVESGMSPDEAMVRLKVPSEKNTVS